jgi:hypothetical protein
MVYPYKIIIKIRTLRRASYENFKQRNARDSAEVGSSDT